MVSPQGSGVGSVENCTSRHREASFNMFFRDSLFRSGFTYPHLHRSTSNRRWHTEQQYVAELNGDVQAFVELLESLGIPGIAWNHCSPPDLTSVRWQFH